MAVRDSAFPWRVLRQTLSAQQRCGLSATMTALLRWQHDLRRWPRIGSAPHATPFVALYAGGRTAGCFGSDEGSPGERVARAFLRALDDLRYGGVGPEERATLAAQLSYLRGARRAKRDDILERIAPGEHGVAMRWPDGAAFLLLPQAARDEGLGGEAMLRATAVKAGRDAAAWSDAELWLFESDDIAVRPVTARRSTARSSARDALDAAARWLASLVASDGAITFAVDGRRRTHHAVGLMHHGRAAMVVRALARHGSAAQLVNRARRRLEGDIRASLAGRYAAGWSDDPAMTAGTVALGCLAGIPLERELAELARVHRSALERQPWHAGQAALALAKETPEWLWRACVADLDARPWAPWTAMAARVRRDAAVFARCAEALCNSIATRPPHLGGASTTDVPEIAQTAVVVEALAGARSAKAKRAVRDARAFLRRWQLRDGTIPAPLDPDLVAGAFPISPLVDVARCDVTAHALLALA